MNQIDKLLTICLSIIGKRSIYSTRPLVKPLIRQPLPPVLNMTVLKVGRVLLQWVAAGILFYQVYTAASKYTAGITVISSWIGTMEELPNVAVRLCLKEPFNITSLHTHGYKSILHFFYGRLTGETNLHNWRGARDINAEKLFNDTMKNKYSGTLLGSRSLMDETTEVYLPTQGWCRAFEKLDNSTLNLALEEEHYEIIVFDRSQSLICDSTRKFSGQRIEQEVSSDFSQDYFLTLELVYHNSGTNECTDYGPDHKYMSHADCVDQALHDSFLSILGCIPPWAKQEPVCQYANLSNSEESALKQLWQKLNQYRSIKEGCEFKACPPPCVEIYIKSELVNTYWMQPRQLSIYISPKVKITRHEIAYGFFELVVDIGSSIGLWVGLSFIGIFDEVVNIIHCFKGTFQK